jgi:hypothetical protein
MRLAVSFAARRWPEGRVRGRRHMFPRPRPLTPPGNRAPHRPASAAPYPEATASCLPLAHTGDGIVENAQLHTVQLDSRPQGRCGPLPPPVWRGTSLLTHGHAARPLVHQWSPHLLQGRLGMLQAPPLNHGHNLVAEGAPPGNPLKQGRRRGGLLSSGLTLPLSYSIRT